MQFVLDRGEATVYSLEVPLCHAHKCKETLWNLNLNEYVEDSTMRALLIEAFELQDERERGATDISAKKAANKFLKVWQVSVCDNGVAEYMADTLCSMVSTEARKHRARSYVIVVVSLALITKST